MSFVSRIINANIHDVIPNPLNPREDIYTNIEDMQRTLKEKGWESPITCYQDDSKYVILSGHRRWSAALKLSHKKIPVFLVRKPLSPSEELERLGSVQGGKIDWSVYEWAKYTYEMWSFWKECSYNELARKLNKSSEFVRTRVNIFRHYEHSEIEENLINGVFTISVLDYLLKWIENLKKIRPELVNSVPLEHMRTTMLAKIEKNYVTILDLKSDVFIRNATPEQFIFFLSKPTRKLSEAIAELGEGYVNYKGKNTYKTNKEIIQNIKHIITAIPIPLQINKQERMDIVNLLEQYKQIVADKGNELEAFLSQCH